MTTNKIKIAKDKANLVKALLDESETTGPFQTYADVMAFAAALGAKRKKRSPLGAAAKKEPGPIGLEIFASRGYDVMMKILAIVETQDPKILSSGDPKYESQRIQIFEEYANGGLEVLREQLRGVVDYTEQLLLIMQAERDKPQQSEQEFDLTRFL
ncbi:MAG: DNA phosphorothioation-associated protein 4 [Hormoscilla sp. GUM202]|nr:DNA phosphorothioation-associated protein 4 [Hormoscilla sp. GUM202]